MRDQARFMPFRVQLFYTHLLQLALLPSSSKPIPNHQRHSRTHIFIFIEIQQDNKTIERGGEVMKRREEQLLRL